MSYFVDDAIRSTEFIIEFMPPLRLWLPVSTVISIAFTIVGWNENSPLHNLSSFIFNLVILSVLAFVVLVTYHQTVNDVFTYKELTAPALILAMITTAVFLFYTYYRIEGMSIAVGSIFFVFFSLFYFLVIFGTALIVPKILRLFF